MKQRYFHWFTKSIYVLIALAFVSCADFEIPTEVEYVLKKAGKNREELEKVLKHYSRFKKDSLKFQSACYLIANIPGHYGVYHKDTRSIDAIFENIERSLREGVDTAFLRMAQNQEKKEAPENNSYMKYDIEVITSDLLISNIERSFYAWNKYPWCKNLTFGLFKKYILPYRIDTEPLSDLREMFQKQYSWLEDSMKNDDNMQRAFELIYNFIYEKEGKFSWEYGHLENLLNIIDFHQGQCYDECLFVYLIMKSLGIVVAFDHIPHWANRSSNHSWISFIDHDDIFIIDKTQKLKNPVFLHSALFDSIEPVDRFLPEDIINYPYKKGAKVYRKSFEINPNSICLSYSGNEPIPDEINDSYNIDITEKYLSCHNITLNLPVEVDDRLIYLCVFDRGQISPVALSKSKDHKVLFKSIGSDVLYLVTLFEEESYYPVSLPFILNRDGSIRTLGPERQKFQTISLKRKYPLFGNVLTYANLMYKGKFQGSDSLDFSNATDLFSFEKTYLIPTEIAIKNSGKYRYYRYLPQYSSTGDIAELTILYDSAGQTLPARGNYIYKYAAPKARHYTNAFDGKWETFYKSDSTGTWIGIDLGHNNKKSIRKIKFCPRTDTNFIIPGNEYELYYWDNGWQSLGKKKATDFSLIYNNVPKGALYWLYCHNGGKEERPFTYENGKQIWW